MGVDVSAQHVEEHVVDEAGGVESSGLRGLENVDAVLQAGSAKLGQWIAFVLHVRHMPGGLAEVLLVDPTKTVLVRLSVVALYEKILEVLGLADRTLGDRKLGF